MGRVQILFWKGDEVMSQPFQWEIVKAFKDFDRIYQPTGDINDKLRAFITRYPKAKGLEDYIKHELKGEADEKTPKK